MSIFICSLTQSYYIELQNDDLYEVCSFLITEIRNKIAVKKFNKHRFKLRQNLISWKRMMIMIMTHREKYVTARFL